MRIETKRAMTWWSGALVAAAVAVCAVSDLAFAQTDSVIEPPQQVRETVTVSNWLVLGPAAEALPAFADDERGRFQVGQLLDDPRVPLGDLWPAARTSAAWFGETLSWTASDADADGVVSLRSPQSGLASAWVAVYIHVPRWQEVDLELLGTHPRRAWLGTEGVARGGLDPRGPEPAPVKATVKLTTGTHRLVVRTVYDPERGGDWAIGARLTGRHAAPQGPVATIDAARTLGLLDILEPPEVTSVAVSPDGLSVATAYRRVMPGTNDEETWVELRATADGAVQGSWRGTGVSQVAFDPAGRWLSYVTRDAARVGGSATDAPRSTLWLADRRTGATRPLVERVERFGSHTWAPDGTHLVYSSSTTPAPDPRGIKRVEGLMDRWRTFRTKSALHLVVVPDGTRRTLTAGALSVDARDFSPDGRRLLVTRSIEDLDERPYSRTEISEIDLSTFERRTVGDLRWVSSVQYAPDGRRLLVAGGPSTFGEVGVEVDDGVVPNEYDTQLYVWEPASGEVQVLTRGFVPAVLSASWSRADGHIYLRVAEGDAQALYRYDTRRARFTRLSAPVDVLTHLVLASGAPVAVGVGSSPWRAPGLVAFDLRRDTSRSLQWPAAERHAGIRTGKVEAWRTTTASGVDIDGRVYLPPDFDSSRRYPLIVNYYAGTTPVTRDFGGRYPKEWWAAQGYVVYVPQPSGAIGYGQAFSAEHVNNWGRTVAGEIVEATRRFLDAHPFVDRARVGAIGASYGGFMTMLLLTETDVFAAGVAHAGISSLSSYWGEGYWGYSYSAGATADAFPWNRRDLYVDQSPLFRADRVRTPLLLTHGTADTNVPVGESDQFFVALRLLGAPVEYLQVEGLDHHIMEHPKRIVWSQSIVAWFDRHLKGEPEWWDELWPVNPPSPRASEAGR